MRHFLSATGRLMACALLLCGCSHTPSGNGPTTGEIRVLEKRADLIADANDIKRLQRAYGFYWDKGMWDDVADLFTADATIEYANEGVNVGQQQIRRYFHELGH